MNLLRYFSIILLFLLCLAFSGCGRPAAVPTDHFYRLPEAVSIPLALPALKGTLSILPFNVGGLYNERAILYIDADQPLELKRYRYHLWNNAPAYLLQEHFFTFMRDVKAAEQVVMFQPGFDSKYKLTGSVRRFERVYGDGGNDQVNVALHFLLMSENNLVWEWEYNVTADVKGGGVHDAVEAFGSALQQIYDSLLRDIKQNIS